jgi:hypothetical protein
MTEILIGKIHGHFSPSFLPFATKCICCNQSRKLWWIKSGMIKTEVRSTADHKMVAVSWDALYYTTL